MSCINTLEFLVAQLVWQPWANLNSRLLAFGSLLPPRIGRRTDCRHSAAAVARPLVLYH